MKDKGEHVLDKSSNYVVFDVETPNRYNNRMSAIGVTLVKDGKIYKECYTLINPEQEFDYFNSKLTGITAEMVADKPTFPELWPMLEPYLSWGLLVAHNAAFDMGVLKKCLQSYGIEWKNYAHYACTVQMGRKHQPGMSHKLNDLCDYYGIELEHHRADSDSHACAEILINYLEEGVDVNKHIRTCSLLK